MTRTSIRAWYLVHKWTSLICTLFLLVLCVTGLPLIFHAELAVALGDEAPLPAVPAGTPPPSLDRIVAVAKATRPGDVVQFLGFDADRPIVTVGLAPAYDAPPDTLHMQPVDRRNGALLPLPPRETGFLWFVTELHEELFLGLPGTLFLGAMGLLFVIAIASGVVLYAPFMRKVDFGTVRRERSVRLKWLDVHNLLGIATVGWLLVVAVTGVFNTLDQPLAVHWRKTQLAEMMAPYRHAPPLHHIGSVDVAAATARRASPDMDIASISFPGTFFSTPHHFNVFMRGVSPVTSRLIKPTLVDAQTGRLTDTRDMPLLIRALFLSRPLHFGDYGGLTLKIVWAILDLIAIVILASGVYLWLGRRGPAERRVEEIVSGGLAGGDDAP